MTDARLQIFGRNELQIFLTNSSSTTTDKRQRAGRGLEGWRAGVGTIFAYWYAYCMWHVFCITAWNLHKAPALPFPLGTIFAYWHNICILPLHVAWHKTCITACFLHTQGQARLMQIPCHSKPRFLCKLLELLEKPYNGAKKFLWVKAYKPQKLPYKAILRHFKAYMLGILYASTCMV